MFIVLQSNEQILNTPFIYNRLQFREDKLDTFSFEVLFIIYSHTQRGNATWKEKQKGLVNGEFITNNINVNVRDGVDNIRKQNSRRLYIYNICKPQLPS